MMNTHHNIDSTESGNLSKLIAVVIVYIAYPFVKILWRWLISMLFSSKPDEYKHVGSVNLQIITEEKKSSDYISFDDSMSPSVILSSFADKLNNSFRRISGICEITFADNTMSNGKIRVEYSYNEDINMLFAPMPISACVHDYSEEPIAKFTLNSSNKIQSIAKDRFSDIRMGSEKELLSQSRNLLPLFSPGLYLISVRKPNPKEIRIISDYNRTIASDAYCADGFEYTPSYIFANHVEGHTEEIQAYADLIRDGARPIVVAINNLQINRNSIDLLIGGYFNDYLGFHDAYILEGHSILLAYTQLGITPNILLFSKYIRSDDCKFMLLPMCYDFLEADQIEIVIQNTVQYFPSNDLKFSDYSLILDKYLLTANYIPARLFLAMVKARKCNDTEWERGKFLAITKRISETGSIKVGIPIVDDQFSHDTISIAEIYELEKVVKDFDEIVDIQKIETLINYFRPEKLS